MEEPRAGSGQAEQAERARGLEARSCILEDCDIQAGAIWFKKITQELDSTETNSGNASSVNRMVTGMLTFNTHTIHTST